MSESPSDTSSSTEESWIEWFCSLSGNNLFCQVDRGYIEDSFNLFGLKQYFTNDYSKALDVILDRQRLYEVENGEQIDKSAFLLYGLIHARYILTAHGLETMVISMQAKMFPLYIPLNIPLLSYLCFHRILRVSSYPLTFQSIFSIHQHRKYCLREFGECPRMLCKGQSVLPMGLKDEPKVGGSVKLYCPKCRDVYNCAAVCKNVDGAYFGPTFPGLFFMSYEELVPEQSTEEYVPRVFGFKIHDSSKIHLFSRKRIRRDDTSSNATTMEELGDRATKLLPKPTVCSVASTLGSITGTSVSIGSKFIELRELSSTSGKEMISAVNMTSNIIQFTSTAFEGPAISLEQKAEGRRRTFSDPSISGSKFDTGCNAVGHDSLS